VLDDESLAGYFEDTDVDALRDHQRAFLSAVTGGPEQYDGAEMRAAHAQLDLTADDFAAVADHLDAALREVGVGQEDRQAVLSTVSGFEAEILDQ
jgi:hemoglobin